MKGFLTFLMVAALLFVGVHMINEKCEFWDIVEVEFHLFIWSGCFIVSFADDESSLHWFRDSKFTEKLKAILFLPVCVVICYYSARYGGEFVMRCVDALIRWQPLDLKAEFDVGTSIFWGEYPDALYLQGLAYSPIIWAILSEVANSFKGWLVAAVFAILLASLVGTINYLIAFILAGVILVLIVLAVGFSNGKRRVFKDGRWQDTWL